MCNFAPFLQGGKNRLIFYLNNFKIVSSLLEGVFTSLYKISGLIIEPLNATLTVDD